MKRDQILAEVEQALAESMPEVEVVDVELAGGRGGRLMRVFVDHPAGVDHQLCAQVTNALDRFLRRYTVEVSSPGIERRLRTPEHFRAAVGKKIRLKTYGPVEGRRNFTGFLRSVTPERLQLETDAGEVSIGFEDIAGARTVFDFDGPGTA